MLRRVVKISSQLLSSRNPLYVHQDAREISNIPYRALVSLSSFSEREGGSNTWAFWLGLTGEVYLQFFSLLYGHKAVEKYFSNN